MLCARVDWPCLLHDLPRLLRDRLHGLQVADQDHRPVFEQHPGLPRCLHLILEHGPPGRDQILRVVSTCHPPGTEINSVNCILGTIVLCLEVVRAADIRSGERTLGVGSMGLDLLESSQPVTNWCTL